MKYPKIQNHYQEKCIDYLRDSELTEGEWIVTEKIHGRNVRISSEHVYSRSQLIVDWLEPFPMPEGLQSVYGENFGGAYKGMKSTTNMIQKGVDYHPEHKLLIFDGLREDGTFINYDDLVKLFPDNTVPILFRGTFDECLAYSNEFRTTIPDLYGLPPLEDNICEGIIIRPAQEKITPRGERVMIKSKNERWSEKASIKKSPKSNDYSEELKEALAEFESLINTNRLNAVLSKGEVSMEKSNLKKVIPLLMADAEEEITSRKLGVDEEKKFQSLKKEIVGKFLGREFIKLCIK